MVDARTSTFSCVDARGDDPMLGTPGGDLSEIMNAAMAIAKLTTSATGGTSATAVSNLHAIADDVFNFFANNVASSSRPLYFHTDDASLRNMFIYLNTAAGGSVNPKPTSMPFQGPTSNSDREWLNALVLPQFNGCGHVRLQLNATFEPFYSVDKQATPVRSCSPGNNVVVPAGNCISSAILARRIIRNFFGFWWFTPAGSWQRQRVAFSVDGILAGPLLGKAVAVIGTSGTTTAKSTCQHHAPLVRPSFGASKVFVYHGDAVASWRQHIANRDSFCSNVVNKWVPQAERTNFLTTWSAISAMQLGATLTDLPPANSIGIFTVAVPISTSPISSQSVTLEAGSAASEAELVPGTEAGVALPVPVEPVAADAAVVDVPVDNEVATAATAAGALP